MTGRTSAVAQALEITLDALADFYGREDGPWLDELLDESLRIMSQQGADLGEIEAITSFFTGFRESLCDSVLVASLGAANNDVAPLAVHDDSSWRKWVVFIASR